MEVLKNRSEFLAAAKGKRASAEGMNLQALARNDDKPLRVGFTATKKVGNAVTRNKAKRRLRALASEILTARGQAGFDYVLVAKPQTTVERPFEDLKSDLINSLKRVHA